MQLAVFVKNRHQHHIRSQLVTAADNVLNTTKPEI